MKNKAVGNISLNHHSQFITFTDSDNTDESLVLHVSDVDEFIKELKKIQKEMVSGKAYKHRYHKTPQKTLFKRVL